MKYVVLCYLASSCSRLVALHLTRLLERLALGRDHAHQLVPGFDERLGSLFLELVASASTSMPALANWASTASQSPPSAGIGAPTSP